MDAKGDGVFLTAGLHGDIIVWQWGGAGGASPFTPGAGAFGFLISRWSRFMAILCSAFFALSCRFRASLVSDVRRGFPVDARSEPFRACRCRAQRSKSLRAGTGRLRRRLLWLWRRLPWRTGWWHDDVTGKCYGEKALCSSCKPLLCSSCKLETRTRPLRPVARPLDGLYGPQLCP